ncbi:carbohydrate porin [Dyella ginsengisoli]|uniref:carbohydrate porin n=1 Tax=Dyella ginsengisoli TaxID=363848 RepID=UPI000A00B3FE
MPWCRCACVPTTPRWTRAAGRSRPAPEAPRPTTATERSIELSYLAQATNWLAVQPDLQYVVHPDTDPNVRNARVFTLRFELSTDLSSHRTPHALPVGARSRAMPFAPMRHKRQKHRPRAGSYRVFALCGVRQWGVACASAARAPLPWMRQSATPERKRMRHANTEACLAPASELSTDLSSHRTPHALPVGARSRAMPFTPVRHKRQKHRPRAGSYRVCVAFDSGG